MWCVCMCVCVCAVTARHVASVNDVQLYVCSGEEGCKTRVSERRFNQKVNLVMRPW